MIFTFCLCRWYESCQRDGTSSSGCPPYSLHDSWGAVLSHAPWAVCATSTTTAAATTTATATDTHACRTCAEYREATESSCCYCASKGEEMEGEGGDEKWIGEGEVRRWGNGRGKGGWGVSEMRGYVVGEWVRWEGSRWRGWGVGEMEEGAWMGSDEMWGWVRTRWEGMSRRRGKSK